jgi:hypothetical protein
VTPLQRGEGSHLRKLQPRKERAVRFVRDVLGDPDWAEEIAEESLEDYADRRKIRIANPTIRRNAVRAGRLPNDVFGELKSLARSIAGINV